MPVTAAVSRAARHDGEASRSPKQILADAASALRTASGFELRGTQSEGGTTTRINVLARRHSLDLGVATGAATEEVLRLPTGMYVRGNARFWTQHLGARGAALADRWIHGSNPELAAGLTQFSSATMARCMTEETGKLSIAGTTSINGRPAIVIRDAGNRPGTLPGTLAVATTGPPYPLREEIAGRQRGGGRIDVCNDGRGSGYQLATLTFSNFNHIPPLQAPADAIQPAGSPLF
jgi:hypothetical protein